MAYTTGKDAAGSNGVDPVVTDLGGLNVHVSAGTVTLYATTDFTGPTRIFDIPELTATVPDNIDQFTVENF